MYKLTCLRCKETGTKTCDVGESARTGHKHGEDHLEDLEGKREGKPLWNHSREEHAGQLTGVDFKMKVLRSYKTPLQRQIGEALAIEKYSITSDILLNSRGSGMGPKSQGSD